MKRFLITLLVLGAIIVGIGFYRGWFTVDEKKINQDKQELKEKIQKAPAEIDKGVKDVKKAADK